MNRAGRSLAIAALVTFTVAHFLPSFADISGFGCERVCWGHLLSDPLDHAYVAAFALDNLILVGLAALTFTRFNFPRTGVVLAGLSLLHVLSWLIWNLAWLVTGGEKDFKIQPGYYLWALSFGLLLMAMVERMDRKRRPLDL
jgi:hypothetical protein